MRVFKVSDNKARQCRRDFCRCTKFTLVTHFHTLLGKHADSAPLIVTLGYLYPVASMITYIVREKELRQKELMKMMSVTESDIGWSWFCTFAMFHLVSAACAAAVADVLYERSSLLLLWILWSVSVLGNIVFSMACSTITSRSARAVLVGLLVYFAGVFLTLAVDFRSGNPIAIAFVSLHPVTAFVYGIQMLGYLEDLEVGLTFDSIDYSESLSGLSMLDVYRFLVVDVFIWGLLSWYLNRAIPPEYGQALPFWFPFDSRYWFRLLQTSENVSDDVGPIKDDIPVEEVSDALKRQSDLGKSIEICNMGKSFGDKKAVDSLCLSMYSGQITALLGHNGQYGTRPELHPDDFFQIQGCNFSLISSCLPPQGLERRQPSVC